MSTDLHNFMIRYADGGNVKRVTEITVPLPTDDEPSPFIVLRCGDKVAIVNPMGFEDHLCVDVHSFVRDQDATAGVFGMTNGRRYTLEPTGNTSHGWHSASLVSVLVGEQDPKMIQCDTCGDVSNSQPGLPCGRDLSEEIEESGLGPMSVACTGTYREVVVTD